MTEKPTHEQILDLIVAKAPALRKAGVTAVDAQPDGSFSVKFAPHVDDGETTTADTATADEAPMGGLDDPAMYGLPPGSAVPGFPALRERARRAKGES